MQRYGATLVAVAAVAGTLLLTAGTPAGAAPAAVTLSGTIQSVAPGAAVLVAGAGGPTRVTMTAKTRVIGREAARLSEIKIGDFIGVDAKKAADASLTAVAINIFPAALKGRIREGQFLMQSGDTMTNAVVAQEVTGVSARTVTLAYQGGTATITVPPTTEIHRLTLIAPADLKPGAHAMVRGTRNDDGSVTAASIVVDQPGG